MKKMKKILLWSIVPILGVSGAVAGVVAATTSHQTSIVSSSTIEDVTSGKNSSSSTIEAVDNESNSSNSTGTSVSNVTSGNNTTTSTSTTASSSFKIVYLTDDVQTFGGTPTNVSILATSPTNNIKYYWYVNKNDGNGWNLSTSGRLGSAQIDTPTTNTVLHWTFKCVVENLTTHQKITSDEVQFTVLPSLGRYVKVTKQPTSTNVKGGEVVNLSTEAVASGNNYNGKTIGYQWFKYNNTTGKFEEISNASSSTYSFKAPYYSTTTTEKYLCRYYFVGESKRNYLNESKVVTLNVEPGEKEQISISSLTSSSSVIKSGESTTLSVEASSTRTESLKYQWYKANDNYEFTKIDGATNSSYTYKADEVSSTKKVTFMVTVQGEEYYLQSNNLVIQVNPTNMSTTVETPTKEFDVDSEVWSNQAPVKSDFSLYSTVNHWWYKVEPKDLTTSVNNINYKWYYVGSDGIEHEISGETKSTFTPNSAVLKEIYNSSNSHRAQIRCKVYKGSTLVRIVDQSTNYKFFLTVLKAK